MTYKIIVSKDANRDIDEIVSYIVHELKNTRAAMSFLDGVEKSYTGITENPFMYSLCNDARLYKEGYRKIVIKNYLIFYRVDENQKSVFIVRVLYGARDYSNLF